MKGRMELRGATLNEIIFYDAYYKIKGYQRATNRNWFICNIYLDPLFYFPPLKKEILETFHSEHSPDFVKQDLKIVGKIILQCINDPAIAVVSTSERPWKKNTFEVSKLSNNKAFPARTIGMTPNIHYCWDCEVDISVEQLLTLDNATFREYATRLIKHGLP